MRHLDLFSGIGGFALAARRVGWETVGFCEIEPYCQRVLAKHWPGVPIYEDVRDVTAERLRADGIRPDIVTGGFPCQDVSVAGKRAGIDGERSGLWSELKRILGELRPRIAVVENVTGLLSGPPEWPGAWFGRVLGDLAEIGFDAEWDVLPASAFGAFHCRQRVWILAYPNDDSLRPQRIWPIEAGAWGEQQFSRLVQDTIQSCIPTGRMGGISDGIPDRAHRLKALGNAIVPQVAEVIFRAIQEAENENK